MKLEVPISSVEEAYVVEGGAGGGGGDVEETPAPPTTVLRIVFGFRSDT